MISCEEAVSRLWEHLEMPATVQEQALLEAHLALCRRCCGEALFAGEIRRLLGELPPGALPERAAARLEELIARLEEST